MADIIEISKLALHDQVRARLRAMLVQGHIPPGAKLNERELSEQLRVSRTPLREAIKLLATEGLVDLLPNRASWPRSASATPTWPKSVPCTTKCWPALPARICPATTP